ncbi:MAG: DUF58 domain-containing protein [Lysobacteraceae bacterium]
MASPLIEMRQTSWRERLWTLAEKRLPALTRLRRSEPLPIDLHRRRIYVLPTRYGLFFALLLFAMTLGSLNYNNNPALILCFLLLSLSITSLLRGYLSLRGLRLDGVDATPVHAGESQSLRLHFSAKESRARPGLIVEQDGVRAAFSLHGDETIDAVLQRPTHRRGAMPIGRLKVFTHQPLGLFEIWSWLHPESSVVVYPALERDPPPPPGHGAQGKPRPQRGLSEEIHALRDYRSGDPTRQVAWKQSARAQRLLVREYEMPAGEDVVLRWDALSPLPGDRRAERLARWLFDAQRAGNPVTLVLPDRRIGPGIGAAHLHACLAALAVQA